MFHSQLKQKLFYFMEKIGTFLDANDRGKGDEGEETNLIYKTLA
jgi:hypothetical protein